MNEIYVSEKGANELVARKEELFKKLKGVQGKKGEAAEVGGNAWHDNFSFEDLCRQEQMINKQLEDISKIIASMIVLREPPANEDVLRIGHIAVLSIEDDEKEFFIGGYGETDLEHKPPVLSYNAPIIAPFFLKEVGKEARINIGGKVKKIILEDIRDPKEV